MNPSMNANSREFIGEIKRCDEMLRRLRYFRSQLVQNKMTTKHDPELKQFNFTDIEAQFEEYERTIQGHTSNLKKITSQINELVELRYVIELGAKLREEPPNLDENTAPDAQEYKPILSDPLSVKLGTVAGVIPSSKVETLLYMIKVQSWNNVFVKTIPIPEKTLAADSVCCLSSSSLSHPP